MGGDYRNVVAENLKRFREWEGLTQAQLAEKSGIPLERIRSLENATEDYGGETLSVLAFILKRSLGDFFDDEKELRAVRFRAQKSANAIDRAKVVYACGKWLRNYCWLEEIMGEVSSFNLDRASQSDREDVPAYAASIRKKLGFADNEPIANVADVLQKSGAKCWFCNQRPSKSLFGLSIAESDQATGVVVFDDDSISVERRIFSTVHEFAHILLHSSSFDESVSCEDEEEENEANLFASHFLMPNAEFVRRWEENSEKKFVDRTLVVKRFFRVGYATVLARLAELEKGSFETLISKFRAMYLNQYGESLVGDEEPAPLLKFDVPPDRFRRMVYQAFEQEEISLRKAANLLGVSYREFYTDVQEIANCQDEVFTA